MARNENINISAPSVKALTNLDKEVNHDKFTRGVYLLHPAFRDQSIPKVDIVFIHGLLGGLFVTWRQRDSEHHYAGKKSGNYFITLYTVSQYLFSLSEKINTTRFCNLFCFHQVIQNARAPRTNQVTNSKGL